MVDEMVQPNENGFVPDSVKSNATAVANTVRRDGLLFIPHAGSEATATPTTAVRAALGVEGKRKHRSKSDLNGPLRTDPRDGMRLRAAGVCLSSDSSQVLLVTSLQHDHWVIPGGKLEYGETPEIAVVREVREEAGCLTVVVGNVGEFVVSQDAPRMSKTQVFLLRVTEELQSWVEKGFGRQRRWFGVEEALCALKPSQQQYLAQIVRREHAKVPGNATAAAAAFVQGDAALNDRRTF